MLREAFVNQSGGRLVDRMMDTSRLLATEKYWLKRARVCLANVPDAVPELAARVAADGSVLADLRIEDGRIRAVLPAGGAPCCCRGVDLEGACVVPLDEDGSLESGAPADLLIDRGAGAGVARRLVLRGGAVSAEGCDLEVACCCTPAVGAAG